jgi:hypothetical protein
MGMPRPRGPQSPFRCFNSSPGEVRFGVTMYVRFPLSLRDVEDLLFERATAASTTNSIRNAIAWIDRRIRKDAPGAGRVAVARLLMLLAGRITALGGERFALD